MIYSLSFTLKAKVTLGSKKDHTHSREDALARFSDFCGSLETADGSPAFFGVTEGILLAEEAHERGYETESWVLDEGMAPHERDWLSQEKSLEMIAYFENEAAAEQAMAWLKAEYVFDETLKVVEEEEQDWNATWKKAFTGIIVDESLKVLPPWNEELEILRAKNQMSGIMVINPGAGFGTGTHETTQLCLKLLKKVGSLKGKTVLDFGSGSGILGIFAALQGADQVYCVEIDPLANENARENASLNGVTDRIQFLEFIPDEIKNGKVDVLLANILRPILLRFAPTIKNCLNVKESDLVLSGLIETDLPQVIEEYEKDGVLRLLERDEKNEWRALWLKLESKK